MYQVELLSLIRRPTIHSSLGIPQQRPLAQPVAPMTHRPLNHCPSTPRAPVDQPIAAPVDHRPVAPLDHQPVAPLDHRPVAPLDHLVSLKLSLVGVVGPNPLIVLPRPLLAAIIQVVRRRTDHVKRKEIQFNLAMVCVNWLLIINYFILFYF